tara:strand:+ start:236 stop:433 length:198 start_codon:yes stop_codon:yes gene_type:complete
VNKMNWEKVLKVDDELMDCPKCKKEGRDPPGKLRIARHIKPQGGRHKSRGKLVCDNTDCDYKTVI